MNIKENRNKNYDLIRTFAIILVVFCHSIEKIYNNYNYFELSNVSRFFRIISFSLSRLGVPLFLCLTGALILKKEINNEKDILNFYKKNLIPLVITYEIWNIIYTIFIYFNTGTFDIFDLICDLFFVKMVNLPNIWYMPMIIGIYIALPFVSIILKKVTFKAIKIPLILSIVVFSVLPSVNVILSIFGLSNYFVLLDLSFLGGTYGIYILLGYYIANKNILKSISSKKLILLFIAFFGITVYIQSLSNTDYVYYVWYDFITLLICGILLFELLNRLKIKNNQIIFFTNYISRIGFAIYLIHIIFIEIYGKWILNFLIINPLKVLVLFTIVFLSSIVMIYVLSKLKFIKSKVFLIK